MRAFLLTCALVLAASSARAQQVINPAQCNSPAICLDYDVTGNLNVSGVISGDGSGLTNVSGGGIASVTSNAAFTGLGTAASPLALAGAVTCTSCTVTGNAFSVGGSSLVVTGGFVAIGVSNPDHYNQNTILNVGTVNGQFNGPFNTAAVAGFQMDTNVGIALRVPDYGVEGGIYCDQTHCDFRTTGGHPIILESQGAVRGELDLGLISGWLNTKNTALEADTQLVVVGTATIYGADTDGIGLMVISSQTVSGQINIGYEKITNNCGAGVTTCTASCSADKSVLGGGCTAGVALAGDAPAAGQGWTCYSISATSIITYAFCARVGN